MDSVCPARFWRVHCVGLPARLRAKSPCGAVKNEKMPIKSTAKASPLAPLPSSSLVPHTA
nr:MAG TPA: hypothetical protein [Microviridae sp.]